MSVRAKLVMTVSLGCLRYAEANAIGSRVNESRTCAFTVKEVRPNISSDMAICASSLAVKDAAKSKASAMYIPFI